MAPVRWVMVFIVWPDFGLLRGCGTFEILVSWFSPDKCDIL